MHSRYRQIAERNRHRPLKIRRQKQNAAQQLHYRIAHRDGLPAVCALPAQRQIREYRNVLIPFYQRIAVGAVRRRPHHAFIAREPPYAYVQEACYASPHCKTVKSENNKIMQIHICALYHFYPFHEPHQAGASTRYYTSSGVISLKSGNTLSLSDRSNGASTSGHSSPNAGSSKRIPRSADLQ